MADVLAQSRKLFYYETRLLSRLVVVVVVPTQEKYTRGMSLHKLYTLDEYV